MSQNKTSLAEIAARLNVHLKNLEANPTVNALDGAPGGKRKPFYRPEAGMAGRFVSIRYVSYQKEFKLSKEDALAYLAWLDDGNCGKHYNVSKEVSSVEEG